MNPAEIFMAGLLPNVTYFIPLILDYVKPNDHKKQDTILESHLFKKTVT